MWTPSGNVAGYSTASILVSVKSATIQQSSDLETEESLEKCCGPQGVFCQIRVELVSSKCGKFKRLTKKKSERKTFGGASKSEEAAQTLPPTKARYKQCVEISGKITSITGDRSQHALQSVEMGSGSSEGKVVPRPIVEKSSDGEGEDVALESRISEMPEGMNISAFTCHVCNKPFATDENLQKHIKTVHNMKLHQCAKCGVACESNENLRKHRMTCRVNGIPCDVCGKTFKGKHRERHMRTHLGAEKKFKCIKCDQLFTKEIDRKEHQHEIHGKCPTCTVCGKTFQYQNTLNLHMIRQHGQKTEFTCNICGVGFPIKSKLLRHKNVHEGQKPYQCATCGKVFKSIESLCGHRAVHSGEPKLQCNQCGAKFRSKYNLARHELEVHFKGSTKNFYCDQCGKGFKRAENLKAHKELHSEERRYKCHICGKSYNIKRGLMVHLLAHDDIKNFHCDLCGKSYRTNSSLKHHMASHSKQMVDV